MENKVSIGKLIHRDIRKEILLDTGETVKIYNPTNEQIDDILKFQEQYMLDNPESESLDDRTTLFVVSLLTNIDFTEIEDELLILEIIKNPSPTLNLVLLEIQAIINEINKIITARTKVDMENVKNMIEQLKIVKEMPQEVLDMVDKPNDLLSEETMNKMGKVMEYTVKAHEKTKEEKLPDDIDLGKEFQEYLKQKYRK